MTTDHLWQLIPNGEGGMRGSGEATTSEKANKSSHSAPLPTAPPLSLRRLLGS